MPQRSFEVKNFVPNPTIGSSTPVNAGTGTITVVAMGKRATGTITCIAKSLPATGTITCAAKSVAASGSLTAIAPATQAAVTMTVVAKANILDGEQFTIDDGSGVVTFGYDLTGDGAGPVDVAINISADVTAADVAARTKTAIDGTALTIAVTDNADGTLDLVHDVYGVASTITMTEGVANAGFLVGNDTGSAGIMDEETFVLDDGVNPATTFRFDVKGDGLTGGGTIVDISADVTAADVATTIRAAINGVGAGLAITAGAPAGAVLALSNDAVGTAGNTTSSDTVADAGFVLTNMANGTAGILDTETVTLDDGTNPASVFEFSTDGVAGGANVLVDISADVTAIQVAARLHAAIIGVGAGLAITSVDNLDGTLSLTNDAVGVAGNVAITDTVAVGAFTHAGMTGGTAGILDTETVTIDDGTNPATVFEFSTDGAAGANVLVNISTDTSAVEVAARLHTAINGVGAGLAVTSTDNGDGTLSLRNEAYAASGNVAIADTVLDAGFTHVGMTGGIDGIQPTDNFTLDDNAETVVFEYTMGGALTVGDVAIATAEGGLVATVKTDTLAAIASAHGTGAGKVQITAASGAGNEIDLEMDIADAGGTTLEAVTPAGFLVTGLADPGGGATTYKYKIVGVAADGTLTAASAEDTEASGPAVLGTKHVINLAWTDPLNAVSVKVYRTADGGGVAGTGLIGTVAAGVQAFTDSGQVATAATPSSTNGTGVGTALLCASWESKTIQVGGTFVATVQMQGSLNGTDWVNEGAAFTGGGVIEVSEDYSWMRAKMTAYTSGTVTAMIAGNEPA